MADRLEVAYAALEPYIDATRDVFLEFEPEPGVRLERLRKTKVICDSSVRDSERHYAACRDDGLLIVIAPEAAEEIDVEYAHAIIAHEFGHAADFLYPGRFLARRDGPAVWVPEGSKKMTRLLRLWNERSDDQVEFAADSVAELVTGRSIRYCGDCKIQCFDPEAPRREAGLR